MSGPYGPEADDLLFALLSRAEKAEAERDRLAACAAEREASKPFLPDKFANFTGCSANYEDTRKLAAALLPAAGAALLARLEAAERVCRSLHNPDHQTPATIYSLAAWRILAKEAGK